jgi:hypothetical protein
MPAFIVNLLYTHWSYPEVGQTPSSARVPGDQANDKLDER